MSTQILKCGCAPYAVATAVGGVKLADPIPYCITHNCGEMAESQPNLEGRKAVCCYTGCQTNRRRSTHYGEYNAAGRSEAPSSPDLPFFKHTPSLPWDEFYCGCHGWD